MTKEYEKTSLCSFPNSRTHNDVYGSESASVFCCMLPGACLIFLSIPALFLGILTVLGLMDQHGCLTDHPTNNCTNFGMFPFMLLPEADMTIEQIEAFGRTPEGVKASGVGTILSLPFLVVLGLCMMTVIPQILCFLTRHEKKD